ncbi:histidine kinase [Bacillus sp. FJAT-42376]|uniref:histidine kinase n=1 Tax=Bacillus sp. FJAT-42376 TaxID=2014076 RepID=UPI001F1567C3|nr:histidine kinase [Bacillus sp. FJAT-42376]
MLFERLTETKDYWVNTICEGLDDKADLIWSEVEAEYEILQKKLTSLEEREAYQKVVDEVIKGVMHSILVMIDGGDELADRILLDLIERDSRKSLSIQTALHEKFFGYLLDKEIE